MYERILRAKAEAERRNSVSLSDSWRFVWDDVKAAAAAVNPAVAKPPLGAKVGVARMRGQSGTKPIGVLSRCAECEYACSESHAPQSGRRPWWRLLLAAELLRAHRRKQRTICLSNRADGCSTSAPTRLASTVLTA